MGTERRPPSLTSVQKSLDDLHERLDLAADAEKRWRALELLTDAVAGLAYLTLGTAVSTLAGGSSHLTWVTALTTLLPGGLLVWFGARLLKAPVAVKAYFLDHPNQLQPFLAIFDDKGSLKGNYTTWSARPEVKDSPVLKHVRRLVVAVQVGLAFTAIALGLFLVLDLTIVFLLFKGRLGTELAAWLMAALLAVYGLTIWGAVAYAKRKRPRIQLDQPNA